MSLLKSISEKHPLSMAVFIQWVSARNTLKPYAPYLRRPLTEIPTEMLHGIMLIFFQEHGFVVATRCSLKGRLKAQVFIRRVSGHLQSTYMGKWRNTMLEVMEDAFVATFRKMERRLESAMPEEANDEQTDVLVGLDVDKFLSEQRKRELSWKLE